MYWQAYLHKTSLVAELILTRILKRAKELILKELFCRVATIAAFFCKTKLRSQHSVQRL
jgi:HD superfamily phosphohydrolase